MIENFPRPSMGRGLLEIRKLQAKINGEPAVKEGLAARSAPFAVIDTFEIPWRTPRDRLASSKATLS